MISFLQSMLAGANQGLLWALLALGVFISFRILDFADLTAEGSFALGGAVVATLLSKGAEPVLATLIAFLSGTIAGLCTGVLHTKLKIPPILAGILTMISLYSINIRIMGKSNVPLLRITTILTYFQDLFGIDKIYATPILGGVVLTIVIAITYWFFGTELGSSLRATGNNERMCRAQGINTNNTKILGLMISNGLIALSGSLVAQQQGYGDVNMGIGAIIIGLASVIIGETFTNQKFPFWLKLVFIVLGSVIYRLLITIVINTNIFESSDLKLLTAIIVIIALALPNIKKVFKKSFMKKNNYGKQRSFVDKAAEGDDNAAD